MKKVLLTMLAVFAVCLMTNAEHKLVVQLVNGTTQSYVLAEKPEITMTDSKLKVSSPFVSSEYAIASVTDFHFEELSATAVNQVGKDELRFVRQSNDHVTLYGAAGNVSVYDESGCKQPSAVSTSGEQTDINLSSMPKGMYIIKTNRQSFKITK